MKKRLAALLAVTAMLFAYIPAYAALTMDDVVFELQTLGIMEGNADGDFELEKPVTRAEFAAIAARMLGLGEAAESYSGASLYSDVPSEHWANGSITLLTNYGIISGTGDGKFSPDAYLSYESISKMTVSCLGYSSVAERNGGYPGGYTSQALTLGLLKNVNISYPFTREATARMVYNALYVKVMTEVYENGQVNYEISNTRLRDKLTNVADGTIEKLEGIVTATPDAYMNSAVSGMENNQIEIDGRLYFTSDTAAARYIGQRVVYYVNTEEANRIISIRPMEDGNTVVKIKAKDIRDIDMSSMTYYTGSSSVHSVKLSTAVKLLKNNRPAAFDPSELRSLEQGEITIINNTAKNNSDIDVILYRSYTSAVVEEVNAEREMIYFTEAALPDGSKYIDVSEDRNDDRRVVLYKADGTPAAAADVAKDSLISISQSSDRTFTEGIISDVYEEGMLTSCSSETLIINGNEYPLERKSLADDAVFNRTVRVYINYMGEAAYIKTVTTSSSYGYIARLFHDDSGVGYGAKVIVPGKLTEKKEEEENENGGAATIISKIVARNEAVQNLLFAPEVYYSESGKQKKVDCSQIGDLAWQKTVSYRLNSNGEIDSITVLEPERGGTQKVYNSYERTFAKGNGTNSDKGGFGVDFETRTICIPESIDPSNRDYLANVEMSNGKTYNVVCYEMNEDRHMMDLIVVTAPMTGDSVGELTATSDIGFVTNVVTTSDSNTGEDTILVTMLAQGTEKEYSVTEAYRDSDNYQIPSRGSLVAYLLDSSGQIENMEVIKRYGTLPPFGTDTSDPDYTVFVGYALGADYNFVSNTLNRWVTRLNVGTSLDEESSTYYEIYKNNTPPVFIYNSANKTAEYGDMRAIAAGSDIVSIVTTNNKVRAVVAIR